MTNQSNSAHDMLQKQLKELDQIFQETMETLNTVAGAERVAKWKVRTIALIIESLGQKEGQKFAALHTQAPIALFRACAAAKLRKVVQISALGSAPG